MPDARHNRLNAIIAAASALTALTLGACQSTREAGTWTELFPHVRINPDLRAVEFDAEVQWDFHNPDEPETLLELVICTPDSKEYESLGVTLAPPSHIHAAMLAVGFEPGHPGSFSLNERAETEPVHPAGDKVEIELLTRDERGAVTSHHPFDWINLRSSQGPSIWPEAKSRGWHFVFGGSRITHRQGRDWYDADQTGTLIGLCTFGGETISLSQTISERVDVLEPLFYVNPRLAPAFGTPFIVRLRRAD